MAGGVITSKLAHPDSVGQSEYRAAWELIEAIESDTAPADCLELAISSLEVLEEVARDLRGVIAQMPDNVR